ncbi:hypothetical protein [Streptomyces sp. NPDC004042]|uniref:hypothetical protein n=1 Tax=Streptomyces sp. NPDC004042 TaxID=3154451 RepID=UPI0033B486EE
MPNHPDRDRALAQLNRHRAVGIQAAIDRILIKLIQVGGLPPALLDGPTTAEVLRPHLEHEARITAQVRRTAHTLSATQQSTFNYKPSTRTYPNRDRAHRHARRRRDAYLRTLYRHLPRRVILGFDGEDPAVLTATARLNAGRLMRLEPPAQPTHHIRHLPDGQIDETHTFPPGTLPRLRPCLPTGSLTTTTAGRTDTDGWTPQVNTTEREQQ